MSSGTPGPPVEQDEAAEGAAQGYVSGEYQTLLAQSQQQAIDLGRKDAELEQKEKVIGMQQRQLLEATNTVDYLTAENARMKSELAETQRAARQAQTGWTLERGELIEENRTLQDRIAELREGAA